MPSDRKVSPIAADAGPLPIIWCDFMERDPVIEPPGVQAPNLGQGDAPLIYGMLYELRGGESGGDQLVRVDPQEGQAALHVAGSHRGQAMAAVMGQSIQIICAVGQAMSLSDRGE